MNQKKQGVLLALPASLLLLTFFIAPIIYIFLKSFSQDGLKYYIKFFSDEFYRGILFNTLFMALKVTIISLALGYPTAYFIARTKLKIKNLLLVATVFPFLVSALVRSYGWMVILGDNGLLNQVLTKLHLISKPLKILYTMNGVTIGLVHLLIPYMILSIASVVQNIDPNLESAAESLGANRWKTFRKVIFPLSMPGVITGCLLVFTVSMTAFVTPKLLGGARVKLMSTMVYQEVQLTFNWSMASTISFVLLITILLVLLLSNMLTSKAMNRLGGGKNA